MTITYEDGLGGYITILEDGDEQRPTRFRMQMPEGFSPPAREHHPGMTEEFHVLRGTLDLGVVNGERLRLREGERFKLPPGVDHHPKNGGGGELVFEATLTPGRDTAQMFAQLYTETRERSGLGQFARVAMLFRRHRASIVFPLPVRVVMAVVASIARGIGLKPTPITRQPTATDGGRTPSSV